MNHDNELKADLRILRRQLVDAAIQIDSGLRRIDYLMDNLHEATDLMDPKPEDSNAHSSSKPAFTTTTPPNFSF